MSSNASADRTLDIPAPRRAVVILTMTDSSPPGAAVRSKVSERIQGGSVFFVGSPVTLYHNNNASRFQTSHDIVDITWKVQDPIDHSTAMDDIELLVEVRQPEVDLRKGHIFSCGSLLRN
jgi:hypothetical protein